MTAAPKPNLGRVRSPLRVSWRDGRAERHRICARTFHRRSAEASSIASFAFALVTALAR